MTQTSPSSKNNFDAIIVGAGFAGLYMLHRLRNMGLNCLVIEAADEVGGTWYWNCYPGARCDIQSMEYSYQFDKDLQQDWEWTERYATQPEILSYISHVADRFDLRKDIQFGTRVSAAHYDESSNHWQIQTDPGDSHTAQYFVMATGCLSVTNQPKFDGLDSFQGESYLTAEWPKEGVDFTDQKVGVIGTGSSGIQSIPEIAKQAEQVYVFQRRPTYTVPAHNQPLDPEQVAAIKADYDTFRKENSQKTFGTRVPSPETSALAISDEEREAAYEAAWARGGLGFGAVFADLMRNEDANESAAQFMRKKIQAMVDDPETAKLLTPDYTAFCRRLCVDTDYFKTYNRENVELVDISQPPIEKITPSGLTTNGQAYEVDALVFALGFDAITGALARVDIRGREGLSLNDKWAEGAKAYLGLMTEGFPNLFMITGPGSPSVLSNMIPAIEQHVEWIAEAIDHLRSHQHTTIEATTQAENSWAKLVTLLAHKTLFRTCGSYYNGENIPGKPKVFLPFLGYPDYVKKCEDVVKNGYKGFELS
ncbi:NAD(P)/FAD-dependent oxidoreductase [Opitutia bacterium ISCC 51]|nr:NAD(P)/FAD-dependent oxidoreductase [Opitutae bacterium ISCC 51]QXD29285.1 NAD(P)/FAD-dependent oxidoreductase [Opitutae bacterium ISCC 52]